MPLVALGVASVAGLFLPPKLVMSMTGTHVAIHVIKRLSEQHSDRIVPVKKWSDLHEGKS